MIIILIKWVFLFKFILYLMFDEGCNLSLFFLRRLGLSIVFGFLYKLKKFCVLKIVWEFSLNIL